MSDVFTYINWRGDLTFRKSQFNEVDNLIFSVLAYATFEGILAPSKKYGDKYYKPKMTLFEAADAFYTIHSLEEVHKMSNPQRRGAEILFEMAKAKRFQDCILSNYVSKISDECGQQFAAITIDLGTDAIYVAFRGTDDSVVGWKEDLYLGVASHIPSQIDARNYLTDVAKEHGRKRLFVGGHSKGGNLAVYAASQAGKRIKNRIIRVYNNDGPGFRKEFIETENYRDILPKVRTIVPEDSIIGMLLEHEESYTVVRSVASGTSQHNGFTWEVLGRHFIYLEDTSKSSQTVNKIISDWLRNMPPDKFREAVDTLFALVEEQGLETFAEAKNEPLKKAYAVLKEAAHLDDDKKKVVKETIKLLLKKGRETVWKEIPNPFAQQDDEELNGKESKG